ncbi:hypothetical protein [Pseudorhodoferax soli]|nr:hypothetical protein [Pseudorhodoferax soli]
MAVLAEESQLSQRGHFVGEDPEDADTPTTLRKEMLQDWIESRTQLFVRIAGLTQPPTVELGRSPHWCAMTTRSSEPHSRVV